MQRIVLFTDALAEGWASIEDIKSIISDLQSGALDAELEEIKEMADEQLAYCAPLYPIKQAYYHNLGRHNKAVLDALNQVKQGLDPELEALKLIFKDGID